MEYINQIVERHNIRVETIPLLWDNAKVRIDPRGIEPAIIQLGAFVTSREYAMLHELGHVLHPLGYGPNLPALTMELAANVWALSNYEGKDKWGLVQFLHRGVKSYINHGYRRSVYTKEMSHAAATLGVLHHVKWVYVKGIR